MPGVRPQLGDVVQIRFACLSDTQVFLNILKYRVSLVGGGGCTLLDIASIFDASMHFFYKSLIAGDVTYHGCGAKNLSPPETVESTTVANQGPGAVVGFSTAQQVSYLFSLKTARAGRKHRGRIYPGPVPVLALSNLGEMTAAFVTKVNAFASALPRTQSVTNGANATTLNLIISGRLDPKFLPDQNTEPLVEVVQGSPFTATQRRRGDYGPHNPPPF